MLVLSQALEGSPPKELFQDPKRPDYQTIRLIGLVVGPMLNGAEDQGSNPRLRFKVIFGPGFKSLLDVLIYVLLLDQPPPRMRARE